VKRKGGCKLTNKSDSKESKDAKEKKDDSKNDSKKTVAAKKGENSNSGEPSALEPSDKTQPQQQQQQQAEQEQQNGVEASDAPSVLTPEQEEKIYNEIIANNPLIQPAVVSFAPDDVGFSALGSSRF
jgi:hypothetical protein